MAFDVTSINYTWVNENNQNLILKALIGSQTASYVQVYPGVKYKENLKFLVTNALTQAGGCGYTASGTTTLTDKDVVVTSLKWTETLCPGDLETTALQLSMKAGKNEAIPFEQAYIEYKTKAIQTALETMYWSATASSSVKCDGLIYLLDNDADVHDVTFNMGANSTGYTFANWQTGIYSMFNHLDAEAKSMDDLTLFVNYTNFNLIQQAMIVANFPYREDNAGGTMAPFTFPGTPIKVVPISKLGNYGVLSPASNLIWATDLVSEEDKVQLWWSQDNQEVRFVANGKIGASYYFGDYIVLAQ